MDVTALLLKELHKDKKLIDLKKVMDVFKDQEKVKEIDVTRQRDWTLENIIHLAVKNGHIQTLNKLMKLVDCQPAFK